MVMSRRTRRTGRLVFAGTMLALALAGCGGKPDTADATAALTADYGTIDAEYQQAQAQLDLPSGVKFPAHLPKTGDRYVPGSGANAAQNFWLCAWLRDYVAAAPADQARAQKAVAQLPRYTTMTAYTTGLRPEGRALVDAAIQGAQHGTKDAPGTFVQNTCGGPFYSQAGGSPAPAASR
jgi:hypothetical protein